MFVFFGPASHPVAATAPAILMDRNRNSNFPIFWRVNKEEEREPDPEPLLSIKRRARGGRTSISSNGDRSLPHDAS
jgi:hypothetical protein